MKAMRLQLAEMDKMIAEKDKAIAEQDKLIAEKDGTFFKRTETVWQPSKADFRGWFEELRRPEGYYKGIPEYENIVDGIRNPIESGVALQPWISDKSGSSNTSSNKSGSSNTSSNKNGENFTGGDGKEIGHQLSDSKTCASTYGVGAQLNLGFNVEKYCAENEVDRDTTIAALQHIVCGNAESRQFGLRSSPLNHLMLPKYHSEYYDDTPDWMIAPIMTAEETMKWESGQAYWVMVMAKDPKAYIALGGLGYDDRTRMKCTNDDIDMATKTVGHYMKAYADALLGRPDKEDGNKPISTITPFELFAQSTNSELQKERGSLENVRKSLGKTYKVKIPIMKTFDESWEVLKVHVCNNKFNQYCVAYPANVAVKAAINCSFLYQQKLLTACPNSQTAQEDELDVLAREFHQSMSIEQTFAGSLLHTSVNVLEDDLTDSDDSYDDQSI